jgi:hypothetical protein
MKTAFRFLALASVVAFSLLAAPLGCGGEGGTAGETDPSEGTDDPGGKADSADAESKGAFFGPKTFYYVRITGWDGNLMTPEKLVDERVVAGAEVSVYKSNAGSSAHCPDGEIRDADLVHSGKAFSLRTSGNFTNGMPKSSYKIKFTDAEDRMFGMRALNLKSMWNDVSQMREALAWSFFEDANLPASRHTYAKFCINGRYYGLYSVIEQVEKPMLKEIFGKNDDGNLYKAYWEDLGPADLSYRVGADGDDSGKQYFKAVNIDDRTYQLKTNDGSDDDPAHQTYDDLATFIRTINGVGIPGEGPGKFDTEAYAASVEGIFDVRGFLRWAGLNVLMGAWDNYYRTPSNYYLYNSGKSGAKDDFMQTPYFHWIPWDYDNSFGIDFFGTSWQYGDLVDWRKTNGGKKLPLIENLLANREFRAYYLDHIDYVLGATFRTQWVLGQIGTEGSGGHWDRVRHAAFLEADGPTAQPHTGRRFTNDQVYWNGYRHHELDAFGMKILGLEHYVRMRHDDARKQLEKLREDLPKGSSGVTFPDGPTPLPAP